MTSIAYTDAWGWSKLDTARECKAKFKYQYIDKLPQPVSPALERGSQIHDALEQYINGWSKTFPKEVLPKWQKHVDELRDRYDVKTEAAFGLDKDWNLLPNWLDKRTWLRAKGDYFYLDQTTIVMGDFKSGKYRVPSDDQLELYAVVGLSVFPKAKDVIAAFDFVDQDVEPLKLHYKAADLKKMRGKFVQESLTIYKERKWAPQPSNKCRWCPYSRQKNGPCKY